MDLLKNVFSLGLGAAAATKEQIEKAVDSLVKKGDISKEDSKVLIEAMGRKRGTSPKAAG